MYFPDWSDLGSPGRLQREAWESNAARVEDYRHYYSGEVFQDNLPTERPTDDPIKRFPVGLNLVKMLCQAQADALFGEWDDTIIQFVPDIDETGQESRKSSQAALQVLTDIIKMSNGNAELWEAALTREVYGGTPFMVKPTLVYPYIKWVNLPLEGFYPVWNPDDEDEILEVYMVTDMTRDQARLAYQYDQDKELVTRVEHWTKEIYEVILDQRQLPQFSGANPWGFVPVVYIPRMRTDNWWGDALTPDLIPIQDELNDRIADIGEALNYNAHPTRYGVNLPRAFRRDNFPLGPNALWDLGRQIGSMPPPTVGLLEPKNPVPEQSFTHLRFLYDWARMSSFAPPIVFGEDEGSQRSGSTLEIRMWSLVKYVRRSRSYFSTGLQSMVGMTGKILLQKGHRDISGAAVRRMVDGRIRPNFYPVLPRDHQALVDEMVKLRSLTPPGISLETAQKELGRDNGEVDRIINELQNEDLNPTPEPPAAIEQKKAVAGKMQPQPKNQE